MAKSSKALAVRGMLIHVSHYDPSWVRKKDREGPFDPDVAVEAVGAMAEVGMNTLIIDCADGVKYKSHRELKRHYSVPMRQLKKVADAAHKLGIDVVPKLNFSKSHRNHHDEWLGPHCPEHGWPKYEQYYDVAEDLMAELVAACRPKRFFHIGMDEDHTRSLVQFVDAIKKLRRRVKKFGLRAVIWSDSTHNDRASIAQAHAEKCIAAETLIPKDIVQMPWQYGRCTPSVVKRLVERGFEVWAAPGSDVENTRRWRRAVLRYGGSGIVLTMWKKCDRANRDRLLEIIRTAGAVL